ncbi:MAG: protein translocase subunit SecD [Candidatus Omnitrophica bacterium]|nr:protein translocase subunit SecD [Candidatus Omnitrophota bacterium]
MKSLRNRLLFVAAIIAVSLFLTFPVEKNINLGLDLKGGMHLVLLVDSSKIEANAKNDAVLRAIEILRNRIDSLGVGETVIQRQGENEILVQLPGVTEREKALAIIGKVAQLEFHLVNDDPTKLSEALKGNIPEGFELKYIKKEGGAPPVLIEKSVALKGDTVADARVDYDSQNLGAPNISLKFNAEGAKNFGTLTQQNVNRRLAIVMDGEVLSAPNIKEPIMGGTARIDGQFSFEEASVLSLSLRSGALPAPMSIEEERTIGPLLGKDSIRDGITAAIIGGLAVFFFMLLYYWESGIIANIALLINLIMLFGIMGFINKMMPGSPLTLTLPGIAGVILTLGMAVDGNILINERIREELGNGRPLPAAVSAGFKRAITTIIDTHITNFIAAFMLFQFGSGPIKGFAVTLSIGLAASLFTSVLVSRDLFELAMQRGWIKSLKMRNLFKHTNFNFVGLRYIMLIFSAILVITSLVVLYKKGESAYGIDFSGGQIQQYRFAKAVNAEEIRKALKDANIKDAVIQQFAKNPETVMIRTADDTFNAVSGIFKKDFKDNQFQVLRIEKVGPVVGKALRQAAVWAIVLAMVGILIYIGFRFKHFDFATAGVIALFHDVIVSFGVLLMSGRQIDLLVVTALMTIAGYSINDTIVVYDRIRENMTKKQKVPLAQLINTSVNETLSRTILTSFATTLVVLALFFKGGEVLNAFSFCLMVGFIFGTYSSIFIASSIVIAWEENTGKKKI